MPDNELIQYGALGILGALVLGGLPIMGYAVRSVIRSLDRFVESLDKIAGHLDALRDRTDANVRSAVEDLQNSIRESEGRILTEISRTKR